MGFKKQTQIEINVMFKIIVFILFAFIVFNLFSGLFYLVKKEGDSKKMVRSLSWRVGLSVALVVFLIISAAMGWISPHALA